MASLRYVDKVWKVIHQNADGSFALDMDYFSFHHSTERTYSDKFAQLVRRARVPRSCSSSPRPPGFPKYFGDPPANFHELCKLNQHYADIAASIQKVTEEVLLAWRGNLHKETGLKHLCIAGGVGLNSVANTRILNETPFERALHPAGSRRRRWSAGCRVVGVQHAARQAAQLPHGSRLLGQESSAKARSPISSRGNNIPYRQVTE